ncbi:NADPH:quinone reductase [Actinophytocola sp.]|uniref:NADPH:quinone reductase n=1 Tax=Actinophytocola sp. TaxID=1872138 RepID=UPI00389B3456
MRAAFVERLGPPDNIRYGTLPDPSPAPDEVLVDVLATTVNPVDTFVRSGAFRTEVVLPLVLSRDLVGTVTEPAHGFERGDLVWCNSLGHGGRQGAAASRAVVPADRLYRLPSGVDPVTAVSVVHPAATAYLALYTHGLLRPDARVLVIGGGGNVGSAAVAMAASAGATVHATASARDVDYCRSLGAASAVDYRSPAWPGEVDLIVECAGVNDLPTLVGLLAPRGRIVLLAGAATRPVLPVGPLYLNDCSIAGFVISHATVTELAEASAEVNRLLAAGVLRPREVEELPLSAAARTHRRMENGELHGRRVVLRP